MKQEFQRSRQQLINNIESSLAMLKQQRDSLLNQSNHNPPSQKIKISTYLQKQKRSNTPNFTKVIKPTLVSNILEEPQQKVQSKKEILENRLNAKQKCEVLKDLYERKKQLESAGIYETNPQKIKQFYQNQVNIDKMKKEIVKNKKKIQEKLEKQKIIQQQLTKVQFFLKQSKKSMKNRQVQSKYLYSQLLKDKRQKLVHFQTLLSKLKLTVVEKDALLQMTFDLLKQYPSRIAKKILQEFLLVNDQFCKIFYLTKEEIMRDLLVHKTQQPNFLNYQQFYEYIKSVEITNKAIKPNLNYPDKSRKNNSKSCMSEGPKKSQETKISEQYLKKVFLYLDQRKQRIVQRERIQIALCKCLLYDDKKMKPLSKDTITKFGQFIKEKRISVGEKSYYKNLDLKYISMEQLLELYKTYIHQSSKKSQKSQINDSQPQNQGQTFEQQIQYDQNVEILRPNILQSYHEPIQEQNLQQNFEKFGWGDNHNEKQHFAQLKQLDGYYRQMKDKYGNEIHWNNYKLYQEDFRKFNQCISQMKGQQSSKGIGISGLNMEFQINEEEAEQYQDND